VLPSFTVNMPTESPGETPYWQKEADAAAEEENTPS